MTSITIHDPIGRVATRHPAATRVFLANRLDFCCSGTKTLGEACRKAGLDAEAILAAIDEETREPLEADWSERPLVELVDHIVDHYHGHHRNALPALATMAAKVHRVHGDKDPERLEAIDQIVQSLRFELADHMLKEERVLFPWILSGRSGPIDRPISVMLVEHQDAGESLDRLRGLTDDHTPPKGACRTWRSLYTGLAELDEMLRHHIHLENNVLFPRALEGR